MRALLDSNPQYRSVTIMRVDWDTWRNADIVKQLEVRRRSTLVMFRGGQEVGRVVARTDTASIQALFEQAL